MLRWLIICGGIHGVHIAARLIGDANVPPDRLRILDPGARLLERWKVCTAATGMRYLRSPAVHHLDLDPSSLDRFAGTPQRRAPGLFAHPYARPSLVLFNEHCDDVIASYGLAALHVHDRAERIELSHDRVLVRTNERRTLRAARVLLAMGSSDQPAWPAWAARGEDPRVRHIFAPGFRLDEGMRRQQDIVVGGGISAVQVALRLATGESRVHIVARHAPREHQFDSDPGWLGPKLMRGFQRDRDPERRRALIGDARHRGSMPEDVMDALRGAISAGKIQWHLSEVCGLRRGSVQLRLRLSSGIRLSADRILLATGFETKRPGGSLIDALIEDAALPCAACGYPLVDEHLRWHPRVFTTGPLAELELGPAARNIAGARRAADRIVASRPSWV
jgi:cation diffusion facilitator CzcD-associated flavoprotein CzcO